MLLARLDYSECTCMQHNVHVNTVEVYLLFIRCKDHCKCDLHTRCHLATSRTLASDSKVRRVLRSHFNVPCHLVQVSEQERELVRLVRFKPLKDNLRGKRLKESLVNVYAGLLTKRGCSNVQEFDDFWRVHLLRGG